MGPTNGDTCREDLGYQNTTENTQSYRILKDKRTYGGQKNSPEALCRVRFKHGAMEGEIKRLAWRFAEPLLKHGKAEWIGWVE
jgi:hypothetical protein